MTDPTCKVPDCAKAPDLRRGLCRPHYERLLAGKDIGVEAPGRVRYDPTCSVPNCERPHKSKGMCSSHYRHVQKGKTPYEIIPPTARRVNFGDCSFEGCAKPSHQRRVCVGHYAQQAKGQELRPLGWLPNKRSPESHGYVYLYYTDESGKRAGGLEHRVIMERHLGRKLLPGENVHHKNGDRADNRCPENLELWSTKQPPGQRVADKLRWALELIDIYGEDPSVYE